MKKFYCYVASLLVAAGAMVGCTEDITTDNNLSNEGLNNVEFIEVTADLENEESRTTLTDGGNGGFAVWSEGDTIGAILEDGTIEEYPATAIDGATATFSIPANTKYAVYPYASGDSYADGKLNKTLVNTVNRDGSNKVFGDKENVMVAHLVNKNLAFKHLCGFIEVKLKGTGTVKHVALRSNSHNWEAMSGLGSIDFSNANEPKFTVGTFHGTSFNWVYAKCSNVELSASEATSFYFVVPPRTYNNMSICVQTNEGSYSVYAKSAIEVNRAKIRPIATIDIDALKPASATNLAEAGVANCYVVPQGSEAKHYSFPARKINDAANLANVAYAHLMWSESASLVTDVNYDAATGMVTFKYEGNSAEGNAVIALCDANHNRIWNWHIWCTDQPQMLTIQRYNHTQVYGLLDRNIGATYTPATVADATSISESNANAAMGLYYQYGRPTPYPRAKSITTATETNAFKENSNIVVEYGFKTYAQNLQHNSTPNKFTDALQYPNLFYCIKFTDRTGSTIGTPAEKKKDANGNVTNTIIQTNAWYSNPYNTNKEKFNLWYSLNNDVVDKKADNDPCPAGYVVEEGYAISYNRSYALTKVGKYGFYYTCPTSGNVMWFPAAGFRGDGNGKVNYVGSNFNIWAVLTSATDYGTLCAVRWSGSASQAEELEYCQLSQGFGVRCRIMDRAGFPGTTSTLFEGQGTSQSPYLIKTSADLVKLSGLCDGSVAATDGVDYTAARYAVDATIDMKNVAFKPITSFKGVFDGKNYTISNLTVTPVAGAPAALFSTLENATVKNLNLLNCTVSVTSNDLCTAGVAGQATNSTISNCSINGGSITSTCAATFSSEGDNNNETDAVVGGIVAYAINSKITGCKVKATVKSTVGNFVGGIAGYITLDTEVSGCTVDAPVICGYGMNGGIVGRMQSGSVSNCLVTANALVEGHKSSATINKYYGTGGIVGKIQTIDGKGTKVVVKNCACYADVTANCYAGGIVGDLISNSTTIAAEISGCLYNGYISVLYKNSYSYGLSGGVVGCCNQSNGKGGQTKVTDCVSLLDGFQFCKSAGSAGYGGVTGYTKTTDYLRCYSNLAISDIVSVEEGKCIDTYTNIRYYGSLHGRTSGTSGLNTFTNCYSLTGRKGYEATTEQDVEELTISEMTNGTLLNKLKAAGGDWTANSEGYPVPSAVLSLQ